MDRRRYPQQQYVPPGMVDFGQINFGHDIVAQQMPEILQNYQQRWDMQDAAIAKLLEEQAGTQMLEGDAQAVGNLLKSSFDEIDTLVKGTYQGDRGAAAMDIVKKLSAARAPLAQARAEKERYDKAFAEYQQSLHSGKVPHIIDPLTGQRRIQNFDEYHELQDQQAFTNKGYTPRQYNALRGAADMEGYLADNVSKAFNAASYKGGLDKYDKNDVMGMLVHYSRSGKTDKEIQDELGKGKGVQFVKQLRSGIPFLNEEYEQFEKEYGTEEANKHILDRAINIVKGQVTSQYAEGYMGDPGYNPDPNEPPAGGGLGNLTRPTAATADIVADRDKIVSDIAKIKTFRKERLDRVDVTDRQVEAFNTLNEMGLYDYNAPSKTKPISETLNLPDTDAKKQQFLEVVHNSTANLQTGKPLVTLDENTGLYKYDKTYGTQAIIGWANSLDKAAEANLKYSKELETKTKEIKEKYPLVGYLEKNYGLDITNALDAAEEYELFNSVQSSTEFLIPENAGKDNLYKAITTSPELFIKDGDSDWGRSVAGRDRAKKKKRGGKALIKNKDSKIEDFYVDLSKGEINAYVREGNELTVVNIPDKALYDVNKKQLTEAKDLFKSFYDPKTPNKKVHISEYGNIEVSKELTTLPDGKQALRPVMYKLDDRGNRLTSTDAQGNEFYVVLDENRMFQALSQRFIIGASYKLNIPEHKVKIY